MTSIELLIIAILFMIGSEVTETNNRIAVSWLLWITSFIIYGIIIYKEFIV